jgi:hypothetical protein
LLGGYIKAREGSIDVRKAKDMVKFRRTKLRSAEIAQERVIYSDFRPGRSESTDESVSKSGGRLRLICGSNGSSREKVFSTALTQLQEGKAMFQGWGDIDDTVVGI